MAPAGPVRGSRSGSPSVQVSVSVGPSSVPDMAEQQRRPRLRVVTTAAVAAERDDAREAYWARLQALRAERNRLRAG